MNGQPTDSTTSATPRRGQRGFGRVYKRKHSNVWWIQYYHRGEVHRKTSGSTDRRVAVRFLKKRLAEICAGRVVGVDAEKVTFEDLANLILDDYKLNGRKSIIRVECSLKHLRPFFGNARAVDIGTDRIARYINERLAAGAARATVALELATLKRSFSLAIQAGKLVSRPHIPSLRLQNARTGFFEVGEFQAVQRNLPPHLQAVTAFLYLTGWRKSEALTLRWPQIDFDGGIARLEAENTKTGEPREFPFSHLPPLEVILRRQREETTVLERAQGRLIPYVFHDRGERLRDFRKAWRKACVAAMVPGRLVHDFRRTAVRNLVRAGVSETIAMKLSGHKTRSVFDRYNVSSGRDLREAVGRLAVYQEDRSPQDRTA